MTVKARSPRYIRACQGFEKKPDTGRENIMGRVEREKTGRL
jgi:hypothetical protein